MKVYQRTQRLHLLFNWLGLLLIECDQRVHAVYPHASLIHMMVKVGDSDILQGFYAGRQWTVRRIVARL